MKTVISHPRGCLYSVAPWASLTGAPICALEHLAVLRSVFGEVCLVLCAHGPLEERAQRLDIPVWCSPLQFRGLRRGGLLRFLKGFGAVVRSRWTYVWELRRRLKKHPGVLHIHSRATHLPYALLAGRWAGVPVVVTLHEPWEGGIEARLDLLWVRLLAQQVIFLSKAMLQQYPKVLKRTPAIVYNFQSAVRAGGVAARACLRVGMAAQMGLAKGTDVFLETCRRLRDQGNRFEARLVGGWVSPQEKDGAWAYIQANHLETVVTDQGLVDDMESFYRQTDVLLFPSRRDSFPRVVMEAMGHGIPVVATRVDGIPEMVEDGVTGFLVESEDGVGFAMAVERLLRDEGLRLRMGAAGRERAEKIFSAEAYVQAMLKIYGGLPSQT